MVGKRAPSAGERMSTSSQAYTVVRSLRNGGHAAKEQRLMVKNAEKQAGSIRERGYTVKRALSHANEKRPGSQEGNGRQTGNANRRVAAQHTGSSAEANLS